VVDRGVVVVVVGSAAAGEPDADPAVLVAVVVGAVVADVPTLVLGVAADDEWAVVSVAARIPRPTALAEATMATAAVIRRTRDIARSRTRIAG
jgi:predicted nucleotidyltransferase